MPGSSAESMAAVFVGAGRPLELRSIPLPEPDAGEALVRIECCTICGSDLHTIRGMRSEVVPSILGHEIVGTIAAVGSPPPADIDGHALQLGERVVWSTSISCGTCDRCQSGLPQKCRSLAKYGHERAEGRLALSGGLAEFLLLRRGSAAIRIGSELPAELICPSSCATATVAAALRVGGPPAGKRVLIFGAGMLGLTAAAFAKSHGAKAVVVCDVDPNRLELCSRFGADDTIAFPAVGARDGTDSFDLILEMSGSPDAVEASFDFADVGAQIVLVGSVMKSRGVQFDPERLLRRWLSVRGVHNYAPVDLKTGVAFLERFGSAFPFADLVSKTYRLAEVNQAIEEALRERPIRISVRP